MNHNLVIAGIVLSPIIPATLAAFALTAATSWILVRLRLYRFLFRRPLVEMALFCLWLAAITFASPLPELR